MATKPNIQINDVVREMTDEEFADFQEIQASQELAESQRIAKENARASALAKLAALGLTEAEIAAL
jgi:hypothetical protein